MLSSTSDRNSGVLSTRRSMFQCAQAPSDVSSRSSRRIQPNISSFQTARHLQPPKRQPCARASCNAPRGLLVCCQLAACRQSGAGTGGGGESSLLESAWIAMLKASTSLRGCFDSRRNPTCENDFRSRRALIYSERNSRTFILQHRMSF